MTAATMSTSLVRVIVLFALMQTVEMVTVDQRVEGSQSKQTIDINPADEAIPETDNVVATKGSQSAPLMAALKVIKAAQGDRESQQWQSKSHPSFLKWQSTMDANKDRQQDSGVVTKLFKGIHAKDKDGFYQDPLTAHEEADDCLDVVFRVRSKLGRTIDKNDAETDLHKAGLDYTAAATGLQAVLAALILAKAEAEPATKTEDIYMTTATVISTAPQQCSTGWREMTPTECSATCDTESECNGFASLSTPDLPGGCGKKKGRHNRHQHRSIPLVLQHSAGSGNN